METRSFVARAARWRRNPLIDRIFALGRFAILPSLQQAALIRRRFRFGVALTSWLDRRRYQRSSTGNHAALRANLESVFLCCIPHPTTGFGHRFAEWNTGLIVSQKTGVPYINGGIGDGWDRATGIESAFEYVHLFISRHNPHKIRIPLITFAKRDDAVDSIANLLLDLRPARRPLLVFLADGQNLYRQHDSVFDLRRIYRKSRPSTRVRRQPLTIAVHVRRGDVALMKARRIGGWEERFVDLSWFERVLSSVIESLEDREYTVAVFSQGRADEFLSLKRLAPISLFIDTDPVEAFHKMVAADVLIASPSSFSFSAGLINPNIKIFRTPWWHAVPAADNWISVEDIERQHEEVAAQIRASLACIDGTLRSGL